MMECVYYWASFVKLEDNNVTYLRRLLHSGSWPYVPHWDEEDK